MTLGTIALWTAILAVSFGAIGGFCLLTVFVISSTIDARRNARAPKYLPAEPEDDSFALAELNFVGDWEV